MTALYATFPFTEMDSLGAVSEHLHLYVSATRIVLFQKDSRVSEHLLSPAAYCWEGSADIL